MGVVDSCAKYFLFVTNLLIFVLSCVILGLGIWVLVDRSSFLDLLDETNASVPIYNSAVILILIVSISSIFISFFGCCGAYKESKCMLGTYFVLILALLVLITVGAIIGTAQGVGKLTSPFLDTLSKYDSSRSTAIETTWDQIQTDMECCGVNWPKDWMDYNTLYQGDSFAVAGDSYLMAKVPQSCCAAAVDQDLCMVTPTAANGAFVQGCFALVQSQIEHHVTVLGGVSIAVIVIMVLNLFLSFYLCTCGLDSDQEARPKKKFYGRPGQSGRV
eukprot:TRINITY_DN14954_c0_g1_i3.p1 TRINITY_DN14954_c0_g1~~TRINITY_DN14954_c0_g1_i3.p1  ORF type:complete len:274 (-),score=57.68 TRINITY_DN14954_c0_g1_i3:40-861(-)